MNDLSIELRLFFKVIGIGCFGFMIYFFVRYVQYLAKEDRDLEKGWMTSTLIAIFLAGSALCFMISDCIV